jgi:hypothetical protein
MCFGGYVWLGDAVWVVQCEVHVGRELGTLASLPPHLELQNVVLILGPDCFQYSEWSEECTCAAASTLVLSPSPGGQQVGERSFDTLSTQACSFPHETAVTLDCSFPPLPRSTKSAVLAPRIIPTCDSGSRPLSPSSRQ